MVPNTKSQNLPTAARRSRDALSQYCLSSWLAVLAVLAALPARQLAAQPDRSLPPPAERQMESHSAAPWSAWELVSINQTSSTQEQSNSDPRAIQDISIVEDGLRPLTQVTLDIQPKPGAVPPDVAVHKFAQAGQIFQPTGACRPWHPSVFWWEAPAFCHRPLYFEEVNLERYGYSCGVAQPFVSAAHFFGTVPALPYLMTVDKPGECIYTLGHYTPGSRVPYQTHLPPPNLRAGLTEAAVMTGLIFVLP